MITVMSVGRDGFVAYGAVRCDPEGRDKRLDPELSQQVLAEKYGVHRRTVRQGLLSAAPPPRMKPAPRATGLDPAKPWIDAMLRGDASAPRKQKHTARRIHQGPAQGYDFDLVSNSAVCDYVLARRPQIEAEVPEGRRHLTGMVPQVHLPGEETEVDLADAWVCLAGQVVKCHLFTLRLSSSGKAVSSLPSPPSAGMRLEPRLAAGRADPPHQPHSRGRHQPLRRRCAAQAAHRRPLPDHPHGCLQPRRISPQRNPSAHRRGRRGAGMGRRSRSPGESTFHSGQPLGGRGYRSWAGNSGQQHRTSVGRGCRPRHDHPHCPVGNRNAGGLLPGRHHCRHRRRRHRTAPGHLHPVRQNYVHRPHRCGGNPGIQFRRPHTATSARPFAATSPDRKDPCTCRPG